MEVSIELNDTNVTCPTSLRWSQSTIENERAALYICIVAAVIHSLFWLQLALCSSVRQKSMQWLYSYLATDILLIFRFFFLFIVHTTSTECTPNRIWSLFICYFEATLDNYLNTLEVYILLALNICRYLQIVHNVNVYTTYVRLLACTHVVIYLIPLISYIIELLVNWAQFRFYVGSSCDIQFTNVYAQTINVVLGYALPILLNIFFIYCNMHHVNLNSRLSAQQHHETAREKYHRSLVIQFVVFYTVWLLLWSPNLLIYQFTSGTSDGTVIASLLNFIEITVDPIIIAALDVRFQKIWLKIWVQSKNFIRGRKPDQRRIAPTTASKFRSTGHGQHLKTTNLNRSNGLPPLQTITLPA